MSALCGTPPTTAARPPEAPTITGSWAIATTPFSCDESLPRSTARVCTAFTTGVPNTLAADRLSVAPRTLPMRTSRSLRVAASIVAFLGAAPASAIDGASMAFEPSRMLWRPNASRICTRFAPAFSD